MNKKSCLYQHDSYSNFLDNLDDIRENMIRYKYSFWKDSWKKLLNSFFLSNLGLEVKIDEISKTFEK